MFPEQVILAFHVMGAVVWIGALVSLGLVMMHKPVEEKVRGLLARAIYLKAAVPAFLLTFTAGLARLILGWSYGYKKMAWLHGKVTLAIVLIALHHILGARTKKMALQGQPEGPTMPLTLASLLTGLAIIALAVLKPF